ncbi:AAA family ATPase [Thalassotalea fonticola]|uniref:AAA family ATPase n=1 Tax=Thalassotalea fonticola TaxID=3065649 RepID=A0ABZ0GRD6_9GAMM|nr:AAA family ATPase [Colwelliaceae bacterium S1-1]
MIRTLAFSNYRSVQDLVMPLDNLNLVTGPNGSGKSNIYKALRLLAQTAKGGGISALAKEGGLDSTYWAGPEKISKAMREGVVKVEGNHHKKPKRLKLGFASDDFSYSVSLGVTPPVPYPSAFNLDPEIKRESIWQGLIYRSASALVERKEAMVKVRNGRQWQVTSQHLPLYDSIFTQIADPVQSPEVILLREFIKNWRFYDHFRTDSDAPARIPQLGTRTMVLSHDGSDLAAAIQTIIEVGDEEALNESIEEAFPGSTLKIQVSEDGHFSLLFYQHGLLRPLTGKELSDGTLRFLLWIAALLTPRPPSLMVINEPETSLHPELLPALANLIIKASKTTQVWVVSHAQPLINALKNETQCNSIHLKKQFGQTEIIGQDLLTKPTWYWPS